MSHHCDGEHMASMRQNPMYISQTRDRSEARMKFISIIKMIQHFRGPKSELQIPSEMQPVNKDLTLAHRHHGSRRAHCYSDGGEKGEKSLDFA